MATPRLLLEPGARNCHRAADACVGRPTRAVLAGLAVGLVAFVDRPHGVRAIDVTVETTVGGAGAKCRAGGVVRSAAVAQRKRADRIDGAVQLVVADPPVGEFERPR